MRSKLHSRYFLLAIWGICAFLSGCQSAAPPLPDPPIRTIAIPVFQNTSFEPGLDAKVTRSVKQEFITRKGFPIVRDPGEAHWVLRGRVSSLGLEAISFDRSHRVAEYRVTIQGEARLSQSLSGSLLWEQSGLKGTAEYAVDPDPGISRSLQDLAIDEAARRLAEQIWLGVARFARDHAFDENSENAIDPVPAPPGDGEPSLGLEDQDP